jgi:hypothetical protein
MRTKTLYKIEYRESGKATYVDYMRAFDIEDVIHEASSHRYPNETYVITEAVLDDPETPNRSLPTRMSFSEY